MKLRLLNHYVVRYPLNTIHLFSLRESLICIPPHPAQQIFFGNQETFPYRKSGKIAGMQQVIRTGSGDTKNLAQVMSTEDTGKFIIVMRDGIHIDRPFISVNSCDCLDLIVNVLLPRPQ